MRYHETAHRKYKNIQPEIFIAKVGRRNAPHIWIEDRIKIDQKHNRHYDGEGACVAITSY